MRCAELFIFATVLLSGTALQAAAESQDGVRPVYSAYTLEAGSSHVAETYLSPLHYDGWTVGLGYRRAQAMKFSPEKWLMELGGRLGLDRTLSRPARNVVEWRMNFELEWGMLRKWRMPRLFTLYAGGFTRLDAGVFYLSRNSNNPVAAKASWTLGPRVGASWSGRIKSLPLVLRYGADMPLTGIFFSPEYGELYYEMYLGNHSGLVRAAWPGNFFRLDNNIVADLRFGATILRVGYSARIFSSKASHIVTRTVTHTFVLGIATEWLSVNPSKLSDATARIISAY